MTKENRYSFPDMRSVMLLVMLLLVGACDKTGVPRSSKPHVIRLTGGPEQMGQTYGKRLPRHINALTEVYIRQSVCQGNDQVFKAKQKQALQVFGDLDSRWTKELKALAEESGCDYPALALGNCFLDLMATPIGCRTLVVKTNADSLLHAHNLDWENLGGLAERTLCIIRRSPDKPLYRTTSLCFSGMTGALDIINEHGVALSFNQLGYGKDPKLCEEPVFILMRRIAETCKTFDEARDEVMNAPRGIPFILTVSGAATAQASVFERKNGVVTERPLNEQGVVCAGNRACGPRDTASRFAKTAKRLNPKTVDQVKGYLRDPNVLMRINLYSVIFDYENNHLHLASGQSPAALAPYKSYPLFD